MAESTNLSVQDFQDGVQGHVGILHLSIAGQIRQLSQIANITHKMACQTVGLSDSIDDNDPQIQRSLEIRKLTEQLQTLIADIEKDSSELF